MKKLLVLLLIYKTPEELDKYKEQFSKLEEN